MQPQKALLVLSLIAILFPTSVHASHGKSSELNSDSNQTQVSKNKNSFATKFRPPNKDKPSSTVGGAVRGNTCAINSENKGEITSLVPEIDQSLTLQAHPNFFAYIPPMNDDKKAILVVKNETEDYYYSQKLMIPTAGGIIKIALAEDAPSLEVGQSYKWFLRIQCNTYLEPEDPQISASITRIEGDVPSLSQDELMLFYANSQIWYDSLNTAFELSKSGKNIYWVQLLGNIGMDRFATQ